MSTPGNETEIVVFDGRRLTRRQFLERALGLWQT